MTRSRRLSPFSCLALAALVFARPSGAADSTPALPDGVLAIVAGTPITAEDFRREMARRGGAQPGAYATAEQRRELLADLVRARSLAAAARAEGLDRDPELIATVERMLGSRYVQAHLQPEIDAIRVEDGEIERFYQDHRGEFLVPARARAAWILIEVPRKATAEEIERRRARAEEARAAAEKLSPEERDLGALAQQYSEDVATRYTGGELGWIYESQAESYHWGPELVRHVFEMSRPGELSPLFRHDAGFYFLKLVERESATPAPLDKLRSGIRSRLLKEKVEQARARFHEGVQAKLQIQADPARVDAIAPLAPAEKPKLAPPPLPGG